MGSGRLTGRDLEFLARIGRRLDGSPEVDPTLVSIETIRVQLAALRARDPIAKLIDGDFNVTTDQALAISAVGLWTPTFIIARYKSGTFTSAAGGVYTATSKGGTAIVAASQSYATLDDTGDALRLTIAATNRAFSETTIYLSLTTAAGAAAIADLFVFGHVLE